ncbi:MAG: metallophosphoesterase family protein [Myxococcales bacterium]|nr:metallophosphoesterase family protein [Myxococcales bacterium]
MAGIIGDAHAEDVRLARALDFLSSRGVDALLQVGDFIDGFGDDLACARRLRASGASVVRGNHERWLLEALPALGGTSRRLDAETLAWVASLPTTRALSTAAGPALLCHALGEDDMTLLLPRHGPADLAANAALPALLAGPARLVLAGHTHVRMVRTIGPLSTRADSTAGSPPEQATTFVNAGTLHRRDRPSCTLVDFVAREVEHWDVHEDRPATFASSHRF